MAHPFTIAVEPTILADLQTRLTNTRWPDQVDNEKWQLGTDKTYLQQFCSYWQNQFDWKKQEAYLNTFPHFKTTIDDFGSAPLAAVRVQAQRASVLSDQGTQAHAH